MSGAGCKWNLTFLWTIKPEFNWIFMGRINYPTWPFKNENNVRSLLLDNNSTRGHMKTHAHALEVPTWEALLLIPQMPGGHEVAFWANGPGTCPTMPKAEHVLAYDLGTQLNRWLYPESSLQLRIPCCLLFWGPNFLHCCNLIFLFFPKEKKIKVVSLKVTVP